MKAPGLDQGLEAAYQVHHLDQAADPGALLAKVAPGIRAVVTTGAAGLSNAIMDALPDLELIAIRGVGTDGVDLDHARSRGLRVTITPDVLSDDVADLAMALLLAVSRRICVGDSFVRAGKWLTQSMPLAQRVSRKRAGILGLGSIGHAIARRALGFGMSVAYTGHRRQEQCPYPFVAGLADLARQSDILFIAASSNPTTQGIVNAEVLDALGPQGILVNIARGSIVDEPALVAALAEGRLGAAGLDVFRKEPQVPEALLTMPNVVLQPHQGSATTECRADMGNLVLANLEAHFAGRPLPTPVA
ncbi:MAG: 2-hydroxyacid dehydrogenase [Holophaga sp.]|nr:2-hydroxyacid dehydrogenase [Holophaga sp.]